MAWCETNHGCRRWPMYLNDPRMPGFDRPRRASDVSRPWSGRPSQPSIASFCTKVFEQLDLHGEGQMSFLGREFSNGQEQRYTGKHWLDAGTNPSAKLLRFECSATPNPGYGVSRPTETVVVWAALDYRAPQPPLAVEDEPDEDENVGVNLQLPRLQTLEKELSELIAQSHQNGLAIGVIQDALRSLVEYLLPRPQAKIAAA
jgi:hypothetical protein